jgi:hypothetical protein
MPTDESTDRGQQADPFSGIVDGGLRVVATMLGFVVILVGLWMVLKIFGAVYDGVTAPQGLAPTFAAWTETVGGDKLKLTVNGSEIHLAPVLAAAMLGGGSLVLAWLSMGVMLTGGKIISWTSGDREAVKRILQHAFGPEGRKPK